MTKDLEKPTILAPMATAVWLIDNTSLSFKQIGDFCDFTEAEINLIADGVIAKDLPPVDPTRNGTLTKEEIYAREQDGGPLQDQFKILTGIDLKLPKNKKYISMAQRRNGPEAVFWLLNYCPELSDAQIIKLARTTKNMIQSIRNKTYKDYNQLVAKDPVVIGYCTQKELNEAITIAKEKIEKQNEQQAKKQAKKVVRKINVNKVKVAKTKKEKKVKKSNDTKTIKKTKKVKKTDNKTKDKNK